MTNILDDKLSNKGVPLQNSVLDKVLTWINHWECDRDITNPGCPFKDHPPYSTGRFQFDPKTDSWRCEGCNRKGDAIDFVRYYYLLPSRYHAVVRLSKTRKIYKNPTCDSDTALKEKPAPIKEFPLTSGRNTSLRCTLNPIVDAMVNAIVMGFTNEYHIAKKNDVIRCMIVVALDHREEITAEYNRSR